MVYQCVCVVCKAFVWVRGSVEEDTNCLNLCETDSAWQDACEHIKAGGDYDVEDQECDDPDWD